MCPRISRVSSNYEQRYYIHVCIIMHVLAILLYVCYMCTYMCVCVKKWLEYICGHIQLLSPLSIVLLLWHYTVQV